MAGIKVTFCLTIITYCKRTLNCAGIRRLVTDVTNASRTMLMNLKKLDWDKKLLKHFDLDADKLNLPTICSSSEIFGNLDYDGSPFPDCPVAGVLGDQQAALVGQHCLKPGTL